jgi:putative ABC transport system permease protein
LKNGLASESSVVSVALSSTVPGGSGYYAFRIKPEGLEDGEQMTMKSLGIDEHYLATYNIPIVKGRDFSEDVVTDETQAFILNASATAKLGWQNALGKNFEISVHGGGGITERKGKVIGLIGDFHYESLYNSIDPLVIYVNKTPFYSNFINIKLAPGNLEDAISMIESKWDSFSPNRPLQLHFLDAELKKFYDSEVRIGRIFTAFSVLSIVISCLGLFGLSAYTALQRTKEIGIRKVMGASLPGIMKLLSREYMVMIALANMFAIPIGLFYSSSWLQGFPYRSTINPGIFIYTFLGALAIALITVSFQTIKAAMANPVDSLQNE